LASPAKEVILLEHKYSLDQAQSKTTGDTSYYYIILLHHTTTSYYIVLTVMSPRSSPMISSASVLRAWLAHVQNTSARCAPAEVFAGYVFHI